MEAESPRCISPLHVGEEEALQSPQKGLCAARVRRPEVGKTGLAQRPGSLWRGGGILFPTLKKTIRFHD